MMKTKTENQTVPNIHKVLQAIMELEKLPEVRAYVALQRSIGQNLDVNL